MDSIHKVETPMTDDAPSSSTLQKDESMAEPPQQTNSPSTRPFKKKSQTKNKKKKLPYKPAYMDVIQKQIDDLKQAARHTYEIQARQNFEGELVDDEKVVAEKRMATSSLIDKLEELKTQLDTPAMLQRSANDYSSFQYRINNHKSESDSSKDSIDFQQQTLTLLHFFYIVRLAQKGFFTLISQQYPKVEPNALVYLCDKLVGSSLFVVKDPKEHVRSSKRDQVFDLLRKLHNGSSESVGNGFVTTFKQVRHLIYDFIKSSATPESIQENTTTSIQPPVWVVVPFNGMVDGSQQHTVSNSAKEKKVADSTSNEPIANDNMPSATDIESTTQPNGSMPSDVEQEKDVGVDTTAATSDTLEDNQEKETMDTSDTKPVETTETPKADDATAEPTSASISSTVDTTETITTDTTTITNNSSTTTNKDTDQEETGWGGPPSTAASSTWTSGLADNPPQEEEQDSGWGTPMVNNSSPPAWEGKLPDDVVTPGDETISGDLTDSKWHAVSDFDQRRPSGGGRGRPGYRGGFGQGRGGGSYRSYGDGRGGGGMRRGPGGSANAGWSKARPSRPE